MSMEILSPNLPVSKAILSMEIDPPPNASLAAGNGAAEDWRKALAKVVPAVVVLRTTSTRAFDTEAAGAHYATGFVVDKRRGILLTNRHVVKPGTCDDLVGVQKFKVVLCWLWICRVGCLFPLYGTVVSSIVRIAFTFPLVELDVLRS